MSTTPSITLERDGDRADLVLTPPEGKPPTLDESVLEALDLVLTDLESAPPRVLILRSASPKYFCVGANLRVLRTLNAESIVPWVEAGHRVINRLEDLPFPTVAVVEGYAMGGGLELAMGCDLIFAAETAVFGQSEARLGFIPGWGGCRRFAERVGVSTAKKYFFTGRTLDAGAAQDAGLTDFTGSPEAVKAEVDTLVTEVCANSAYAVSTFKKILNTEILEARERNGAFEAENSRGCLEDPDTLERLNAFLEKRS